MHRRERYLYSDATAAPPAVEVVLVRVVEVRLVIVVPVSVGRAACSIRLTSSSVTCEIGARRFTPADLSVHAQLARFSFTCSTWRMPTSTVAIPWTDAANRNAR